MILLPSSCFYLQGSEKKKLKQQNGWERFPRATLGKLYTTESSSRKHGRLGDILLCHNFSESSSRKRRRGLPRVALGKDIVIFFQKYLGSYLKLLLINVTSGATCQLERTHTNKRK